jgi:hypothetical protein
MNGADLIKYILDHGMTRSIIVMRLKEEDWEYNKKNYHGPWLHVEEESITDGNGIMIIESPYVRKIE